MTLTGKDAEKFVAETQARVRAEREDALASAKAAADARRKEPFDLDKLETMCDTSSEGRLDARDRRVRRFEELYYVHYPDILTLAEFARKITESNRG
jgi:hypothetical protein